MNRFQRAALTTFILLEVLIFAGALVRATGSGLGCPDWPFCYGCLVPPTSADQIDFAKLDLAKFKKKAALAGEDPAAITTEMLRARFNPVETWIEYLNRVSSIPLMLALAVLLVAAHRQPVRSVRYASWSALALFFGNAVLGALVVKSLLKPGNVTLHMALAILMLCVLVFAGWRGGTSPWVFVIGSGHHAEGAGSQEKIGAEPGWFNGLGFVRENVRFLGFTLFLLVVLEGVMGSQVREMTDALARTHHGQPRSAWVGELEQTWMYVVHRSFSWLVLLGGMLLVLTSAPADRRAILLQRLIAALIIAQMLLGVVLSQIGILAVAQVFHIGLSSLLVSALFLWVLAARSVEEGSLRAA